MNVDRMVVAHVAVGVQVAGLENHLALTVRYCGPQEDLALAVEPGRHAVAVGAIGNFDPEFQAAVVGLLDLDVAELVAGAQQLETGRSGFAQQTGTAH